MAGNFVSDPVVHRAALATVVPIGLVCCKNPVVRCDCDCWRTDRIQHSSDPGLRAFDKIKRADDSEALKDDNYSALCNQGDVINGI